MRENVEEREKGRARERQVSPRDRCFRRERERERKGRERVSSPRDGGNFRREETQGEKDRGEGSRRREKKTPLATEIISVARREESGEWRGRVRRWEEK